MTGSGGIGNGVIWSGHCGQFSNMKTLKSFLTALALLALAAFVFTVFALVFADMIGGLL